MRPLSNMRQGMFLSGTWVTGVLELVPPGASAFEALGVVDLKYLARVSTGKRASLLSIQFLLKMDPLDSSVLDSSFLVLSLELLSLIDS